MPGRPKRKCWVFVTVMSCGTAARWGGPSLCLHSSGRQQGWTASGLTQLSHLCCTHKHTGSDNIPEVLGCALWDDTAPRAHSFPMGCCQRLAALPHTGLTHSLWAAPPITGLRGAEETEGEVPSLPLGEMRDWCLLWLLNE